MIRLPAAPARDAGLLAARIGIGVAFAAHGWQKLVTNGLDATASGMADAGVPAPRVSALFAGVVEFAGGLALALGAATTVAGLLLAVVMAGAFLFVHAGNGPFVSDGGWELVVALGAVSLFLAATGPGRVSVDYAVRRFRRRPEVVAGEAAGDVGGADAARELDLRGQPSGAPRRSHA